jgi:GTP-binding protein EngB required for normal cell division
LFGEIAFSELSGKGLRAYGALDTESERLVAGVVQDLRGLVARAQDLLRGVHPASVKALVDRVEGTTAPLVRRIWGFVLRHELVDVYTDVAAVAERAAAPAADIGVFGRTNAGKSSLINALVGRDVLPVGAVPTTAIPLRLARGAAVLRLRKAGAADEELPLDSLSRYTLESLGSDDTDVVAMDALVPTAPEGLRFIDTPGVGAYATPVGARAFEWLPRCDLGILLVPAGFVLEAEDVALVRGLGAAGVEVIVVLSKADLVAPDDLEKAMQHVHRELQRVRDGQAPPILALSVASGHEEGLQELRRTLLEPLAAERTQSSAGRIRRRLAHLLALVEAAYEGRTLESLEDSAARKARLDATRANVDRILDGLRRAGPEAMRDAAEVLSTAPTGGRFNPLAGVGQALSARPAAALRDVRQALDEAAQELPGAGVSETFPIPPLFDFPLQEVLPDLRPDLRAPWLFPGTRAARSLAPAGAALDEAYRRYAQRLHTWAAAALEALGGAAPPADGPAGYGGELEALHRALAALEDDGAEASSATASERRQAVVER